MWFRDFQTAALKHYAERGTALNDSVTRYGVTLKAADAAVAAAAFRCIGVHHLTNTENRMKHNVYVDILGKSGERLTDYPILVRNGRLKKKPLILDKPDSEPAGNYPLFWSDTLTISVLGECPSDTVGNLHTRHGDEGKGNRQGHHSFYVVFRLVDIVPEEKIKKYSLDEIIAALKQSFAT